MLIIDLDNPTQKKAIVPPVVVRPVAVTVPKPIDPVIAEVVMPAAAPKATEDQKERILRKLDEEERYVRHQRAMNHQKFFDQMGPDLLPMKGADFSEVYNEQRVYRERLKSIYLKRQQLEKTGSIDQPKYFTDTELAKLGALKHDRSNAYKLISKLKKKVQEASIKHNTAKMTDLETKMDQLSMKIMEMSHEIEKLEKNALVS